MFNVALTFKKHSNIAYMTVFTGVFLWSNWIAPIAPAQAETIYEQPYYRSESYLNSYYQAINYYNPKLSDEQVRKIAKAILHYSYYYGIDPRLVMAIIACESGFRPRAISSAGAIGLGQLMPGTARQEGVNPYDNTLNIHGLCRVLCGHLKRYGDDGSYVNSGYSKSLELALAAYNAGPGAVQKYGGIPPYPETVNYISKVLCEYRSLLGLQ